MTDFNYVLLKINISHFFTGGEIIMVKTNLPVIFLKDVVLLPNNELRIELHSENEKMILGLSEMYHDNHILLVNLKNPKEEQPLLSELPKIAVLAKIKTKIELPNGIVRLVFIGIDRVEILNYIENNEHKNIEAFIISTKDYEYDEFEAAALKRILFRDINNFIDTSPYMSNSILGRIDGIKNISILSDMIANELPLSYKEKLKYIDNPNPMARTRMIIEDLNKELETIKLENAIENSLKKSLEDSQKEYVLREKIKIIKEELGDVDLKENDVNKLKIKIDELIAPDNIKTRLINEINKYELMASSSPEITIVRSYIDWLIHIPWCTKTIDNSNLKDIQEQLDKNHYDLKDIKTRIIEHIAVTKHTKNIKSPIICLVGPPGVGKTTLAMSIAEALHKKFIKISVGGIRDEAEIVGHRRTYIGANPGKIIQGLKKAGSNNPVFLIDEIDKMTKDYRGDPASALLDVLDKEQNSAFVDNFIEEEVDLSNVMFILTANSLDTIPEPLKDRLEIIELSSYTVFEKINILKKYLMPKLIKQYNIKAKITVTDEIILKTIKNWTKEAGVRELERIWTKIIRKIIIEGSYNSKEIIIDDQKLIDYIGEPKYIDTKNEQTEKSGIINGIAWTAMGGTTLKVSVASYPGTGEFEMTGSLGEIMKESIKIAITYIKSNSKKFNIDINEFKTKNYHIHFEEGAISKDGPSAGITITTAIISLIKNIKIKSSISMTGEITLRGKILPIGGIKEKLIAAISNNIKEVYLPIENKSDVLKLDNYIKDNIKIIYVNDYEEIYNKLFKK